MAEFVGEDSCMVHYPDGTLESDHSKDIPRHAHAKGVTQVVVLRAPSTE